MSPGGDADRAFLGGFTPFWIGDRGGTPDFVSHGALAVATPAGRLVATAGDPDLVAFLRSSAKPFQALALLRRGLAESLRLGAKEIACACASHSGEERHASATRRILAAAGIPESALLCGTHAPMEPDGGRSPVHNNCSGKHAAMLLTCRHEGWNESAYTARDHPIQLENAATLAAFAGLPVQALGVAVDNCTVPTFALPLRHAARAMARLSEPAGLPEDLGRAAAQALGAMAAEPGFVGGAGRFDTAVMEATGGRLVVKTGASGYHAGVRAATAGRGALGFALKLAGGEGENAKARIVAAALAAAGVLEREEAERLASFDTPQLSCRGTPVGGGRFVGRIVRHD